MGQSPSFYNLFSRGRYHRGSETDAEIKRRQNRTEEFAVAALAFALKHDPVFLENFLAKICGIAPCKSPSSYTVTCQAGQYADLLIERKNKEGITTDVIIIEAKIWADLQPIQNPWDISGDFTKDHGYGKIISNRHRKLNSRYYVVLHRHKESRLCPDKIISDNNTPSIQCNYRRWADLRGMEQNHPLLADLLDTLGEFGLPELSMRKFQDLKLQEHTKNSAAMYCLLQDVAKEVGIKNLNWGIEFHKDGGIMGINLEKSLFFKGQTENYFSPANQIVGWFGYEDQGRSHRLTIWFYTANENFKNFVERETKLVAHKNEVEDDGFFFIQKEQSTEDDMTWLHRNLQAVKEDKLK